MIRNTPGGYGRVAIAFHWSMAVLIVFMLVLGLYMHELPQTDPATFRLYQLHKSVGFVVLALAVLRLFWRFLNPAPKLPDTMKPWERLAAHAGHIGLYALMFALPLSGWLMVSASPWNIPTVLFDVLPVPHLPVPEALGQKAEAEATLKTVHALAAYTLVGLLVAHIGAALKHHFIARDETLRRMVSTAPAKSAA
ncbi:cytochrome b [Roseibium aggregatum]|uniref:Cytochrome b n=1 Tax=Roseibium aggregatum TaxID=187304 RepID=A0A926S5N9_9HYPH|nr:cytochrome b [Roseibium aggregatum]MBD1546681.1 cytochrome b [Roseibium aggregatum]